MSEKKKEQLLVLSKVRPLLAALPGVKTIGADVLVELSEQVRRSIPHAMTWCRLSPTGRLMVQKESTERQLSRALHQGSGFDPNKPRLVIPTEPTQEERVDDSLDKTAWRMAAFNGDTLLGFHEWNKEQK